MAIKIRKKTFYGMLYGYRKQLSLSSDYRGLTVSQVNTRDREIPSVVVEFTEQQRLAWGGAYGTPLPGLK